MSTADFDPAASKTSENHQPSRGINHLEADELAYLEKKWQLLETLHYDEYTRGDCTFAEQRRRRVRGMRVALGRGPSEGPTADDWFEAYLRHYRAAWRAFDDVPPALAALATAYPSVTLGVVTNGEGEPQRAKLAAIGLSERFQMVLASGDEGVAKPEAEIFALACERLGVEGEQTAHVGDRLDLDAEGAFAAGLHGIWLNRLDTALGHAHIPTISTLHELPAVLRRFSGSN